MTLSATLHWLTLDWLDDQRDARESIMFGAWATELWSPEIRRLMETDWPVSDGIGAP